MGRTTTKTSQPPQRKQRPAHDPEARENQLIARAVDLVEQRLINGTASSQETVHFLRLGSTKERLEKEKLKNEVELLKAKTESFQSMKSMEESYKAALEAMRTYSGNGGNDD